MAPVRTRDQDHVRIITIDRPEVHNCIDGETARALLDAWRSFRDDEEAHVAVVTGAGAKAFCTGADLNALETLGPPSDASPEQRRAFQESEEGYLGPTRMTDVHKPVLAAIEGHCLAGGLELALLADLRIASRTARLGLTNRRWNVPLVDGGTQRLHRVIGWGRAMEMVLTGRVLHPKEALDWGLVNEVVGTGHALDRAVELATEIAALPQESLRGDKEAMLGGWGRTLKDGLRVEAAIGDETIGTDAFQAGVGRFSDRRT